MRVPLLQFTASDSGNSSSGNQKNSDISFSFEIDNVDEKTWTEYVSLFDDSSLYQTWQYARQMKGGKKLSHFVVRLNNKVVSIAQLRIMTFPFTSRGIAYLFWGPLWKIKGQEPDILTLRYCLKVLIEEYVIKRKLMLRIVPGLYESSKGEYENILNDLRFEKHSDYKDQQTIILDLSLSMEQIRKNFTHNWRNRLNVAENNNLEVEYGTNEDFFIIFRDLYNELLKIKSIPEPVDIDKFINIQRELPDNLKMKILICKSEGKPVAGIVVTFIGETAICILAAANKDGRKLVANYLMQWKMISILKQQGCRWYDMGGISKEDNPGGYQFKSGMGGTEVRFLGQYEYCHAASSRFMVNTGEYLKRVHSGLISRKYYIPYSRKKNSKTL